MKRTCFFTFTRALVLVLSLCVLIPLLSRAGEFLYWVDFNPPMHQEGQTPAFGQGVRTPSSIVFGNPTVVSSFDQLTNQSLLFTAIDRDQIRFVLGKGASAYFVEFDFETRNLNGSLYAYTVFFDTPIVQSFILHGGLGNIQVPSTAPLGAASDNELHHMRIDVNLANGTWRLQLDNRSAATGRFSSSSGDVQAIRFSLNRWHGQAVPDPNVQVAIDNVRIGSSRTPAPPQVICSIPELVCPEEVQNLTAFVQSYSTNPLRVSWQVDGVTVETNLIANPAAIDGFVTGLRVPLPGGRPQVQFTATTDDTTPQVCSRVVQVGNVSPPAISTISAQPKSIWPPTGRMVPVRIDVQASQDCGAVVCRIVQVSTSDAHASNGRNPAAEDWRITGDLTLEVRADRGNGAAGREYLITVECRDSDGNTSTEIVKVSVSRNER